MFKSIKCLNSISHHMVPKPILEEKITWNLHNNITVHNFSGPRQSKHHLKTLGEAKKIYIYN